jgi:hypothetical protein
VEGGPGPESWTSLSSESTPKGSVLRFVSWQTLDGGGHLPLEAGYVHLTACRLGFTLGPEDPGASFEVSIPWPGLEKELAECAREVATVPAWTGDLDVNAASRPCRGTCVYAQQLPAGKTVCYCAVSASVVHLPTVSPAPDTAAPSGPEPSDPATPPHR